MNKVKIIGAGMAGLLSGAMLRDEAEVILEAQPSLPSNHSAVLRFRSPVVGHTLGIPFKQVSVMKAVHPWRNLVADNLAYSLKANGSVRIRSASSADGTLENRFIAPTDMVARMRAKVSCPIEFNQEVKMGELEGPVISTVPMNVLMSMLGWEPRSEFNARPGQNWVGAIVDPRTDVYCSVYDPDPDSPVLRASITGDQLIVECVNEFLPDEVVTERALRILGIGSAYVVGRMHQQRYAKIQPIDEQERREFILWATEMRGVYSLGRYATWRPGLLLDDVVNDVRVIQSLMANRGASYRHRLKA